MSSPLSPSCENRPLEQLKVSELKEELRKRGLSQKGIKKELFERLEEAIRNEGQSDSLLFEGSKAKQVIQETTDIREEAVERSAISSCDVIDATQQESVMESSQILAPSSMDPPLQGKQVDGPYQDVEPKKGLNNVVSGNDDIVSCVEDHEKSSLTYQCSLNAETCAQEFVDDQPGTEANFNICGEGSLAFQAVVTKASVVKQTFVNTPPQDDQTSTGQIKDGSELQVAGSRVPSLFDISMNGEDDAAAMPVSLQAQGDSGPGLASDVLNDAMMPKAEIGVAEPIVVANGEILELCSVDVKPVELHALSSIMPASELNHVPTDGAKDVKNDVSFSTGSNDVQREAKINGEDYMIVEQQVPTKMAESGKVTEICFREESSEIENEFEAGNVMLRSQNFQVNKEYEVKTFPRDSLKDLRELDEKTCREIEHKKPRLREGFMTLGTKAFEESEHAKLGAHEKFKSSSIQICSESDHGMSRPERELKHLVHETDCGKSKYEISRIIKDREGDKISAFYRQNDLVKDSDSEYGNRYKRKSWDMEASQQEFAKRQRHRVLVVDESSKSLTEGVAKDIAHLEGQDGSSTIVKATMKGLPVSKTMPPAANGDNIKPRVVPQPKCAPTSSLRIDRFIRPFTLNAAKDLLKEYGQVIDFWMDHIKTHCYVSYSTVAEAHAARDGLYDKQWPPSFGNRLVAEFVDSEDVKVRSEGLLEKAQAAAPALASQGAPPLPARSNAHMGSMPLPPPPPPPPRMRQYMPSPVNVELDPPLPTLDDLFMKTKTKPHIYYLPLNDQQVAAKLAALDDKEKQLKSKQVARS